MDDPDYFAFYKTSRKEFISTHFNSTIMGEYIRKHKSILQPNFEGLESEKPPYSHLQNPQNFSKAVSDLEKYINERYLAATAFKNK